MKTPSLVVFFDIIFRQIGADEWNLQNMQSNIIVWDGAWFQTGKNEQNGAMSKDM